MRRTWILGVVGSWLGLAIAAAAVSPGPAARRSLLPLGVCEGGATDGEACLDDFDCEGPGRNRCTTDLAPLRVRGVLTLIADKDSGGFDDTSAVPEAPYARGTPIPLDLTRSTLTVMLEFRHRGRTHVLTETYQDLGDYANPALSINCRGFCVPTWREPAVEARIASLGDGDDDGGGGGGEDHDLPDVRTHEHNRAVALRIQDLAAEVHGILEDREEKQVARVKKLLERYYRTRDETAKQEFEEANQLYPLVFARAFQELKADRDQAAEAALGAEGAADSAVALPEIEERVYPLDETQRELVLEIERVAEELQRDRAALKACGAADDILKATCAKLLARAKDSLTRRDSSGRVL